MKLHISYENNPDEKVEVRVKPKHIAAFEAAGFRMSGDESAGISWIYRLAWFAVGRPDTYESWLDAVDDVESQDKEPGEGDSAPPT